MTASPTALVDRQLEAYNRGDLEAFLACYSDDVVFADLGGAVSERGQAALRARYGALFAAHPQNRARILNRIVIADRVIDHEAVDRGGGGARFETVAIYMIKGDKIARVDFVKS